MGGSNDYSRALSLSDVEQPHFRRTDEHVVIIKLSFYYYIAAKTEK